MSMAGREYVMADQMLDESRTSKKYPLNRLYRVSEEQVLRDIQAQLHVDINYLRNNIRKDVRTIQKTRGGLYQR